MIIHNTNDNFIILNWCGVIILAYDNNNNNRIAATINVIIIEWRIKTPLLDEARRDVNDYVLLYNKR